MKNSRIITLFILLLLSCSKQEQVSTFTIEGNTGIPNGTVYLYGTDSRYQNADTAVCDENGYFSFTIATDTIIPLALITPDMRYVPVYGEPLLKAELLRDSTLKSGWSVRGGVTQAMHDSISRVLDACTRTDMLYENIDAFIATYPISDVNIEIIRRYMVGLPITDNRAIRSRISNLGGTMKDHSFFVTLKEKADSKASNIEHRSFPSFSYTVDDSTEYTQEQLLKKYTLVTFWASWDKNSRERIRMLADIQDSIKSKSFAILNISLDYDSAAWRQFITEDSIAGSNVIDSRMFNSPIAKQFSIKSLPFTMLVSPYQRILKYDVDMEGIAAYTDSLTKKYDKDQKKKEEQEKKKNKKKTNKKR